MVGNLLGPEAFPVYTCIWHVCLKPVTSLKILWHIETPTQDSPLLFPALFPTRFQNLVTQVQNCP